jgi:hypothetical protein
MLRPVALLVLALSLAACGGATSASTSGPCGPCQASAAAGSNAVAPLRSPKVEQLAQLRVELARKRLMLVRSSVDHGKATLDDLFTAFRDVAAAARDSGFRGEALRRPLADYRDAVLALRDLTHERLTKGLVSEDAESRVASLVAEAELWLAEASPGP